MDVRWREIGAMSATRALPPIPAGEQRVDLVTEEAAEHIPQLCPPAHEQVDGIAAKGKGMPEYWEPRRGAMGF